MVERVQNMCSLEYENQYVCVFVCLFYGPTDAIFAKKILTKTSFYHFLFLFIGLPGWSIAVKNSKCKVEIEAQSATSPILLETITKEFRV